MPLTRRISFLTVVASGILAGTIGFALVQPDTASAYGEGGYYSYGQATYSVSGHIIGSGSFTTPNCVPPLSASCTFSPTSVTTGQAVNWSASSSGGSGTHRYSWSGTDGLTCSGQPSSQCSSVSKTYSTAGQKTGSVTVTAGSQSTTVSCTGSGGATGVTVTATPTINSFNSSPSSIAGGGSASLSWSSSNATSCTLTPGFGSVPTSGSQTVSPSSTTTYTLICAGAGGSDSESVTVTVLEQCNDGIDNDGDGKIDYPADPDCTASGDDSEAPLFGQPAWKEVVPE